MASVPSTVTSPGGDRSPTPGRGSLGSTSSRRGRAISRLQLSERRTILQAGDVAAATLALALATYPSGLWDAPGNAPVWIWFLSLAVLDLVVLQASDANDLRRASNAFRGSYSSVRAWMVVAFLYLALPYVSAPLLHSRATAAYFVVFGCLLRFTWRSAYALLLRQPHFVTDYVIIGSGLSATALAQGIRTYLGADHRVLGCIHEDELAVGSAKRSDGAPPVIGGPAELDRLITLRALDTLILANSSAMPDALYRGVIRALESGIRVVPMPVFYEAMTGRIPVEHVGDYWFVVLPQVEHDWLFGVAKRGIDFLGGLVGLAVCVLLGPFIALAMRVSSPGAILYRQTRLGQHGRTFEIWKFRSMVYRMRVS